MAVQPDISIRASTALDFVAGKPPEFTKLEPNALEIPTVRSPNEALFDTIKELPVRELVLDGHRLLANLNGMVQDGEGKPGALPAMLADLRRGEPFIPGDLDRTLLLDLSSRSGVYDIDDASRHELRDQFWWHVQRLGIR